MNLSSQWEYGIYWPGYLTINSSRKTLKQELVKNNIQSQSSKFIPLMWFMGSVWKILWFETSILFDHSNLIDFNKNIHIVFAALNKWFRANLLSLNFNKTNYAHFTTKRNMSVNLKIGINNNLNTIAPTQNSWGWQWIILCLGIIISIFSWKN